MKIGELAERAGVPVSTIRYYERVGLMPTPPQSESRYRDYSESDFERLRFIRSAKAQRLPLKLIKQCLAALDGSRLSCVRIATLLREHMEQLDEQLSEIKRVRNFLRTQIALWESGELPSTNCLCAIIETGALKEQHRRTKMNQSTIEVYVASCGLCEQAKRLVAEVTASCGCRVEIYPADSDRARDANVIAAPTIVKDGKVLFCGLPTRAALEAALGA